MYKLLSKYKNSGVTTLSDTRLSLFLFILKNPRWPEAAIVEPRMDEGLQYSHIIMHRKLNLTKKIFKY